MEPNVATVIPAYRTADSIADVLSRIDASVARIFVVDDCCPDGTGHRVRQTVTDPRVSVLFNARNLGVGGATAVGFRAAFDAGADIIVKLDGDGQHRPEWVPLLVAPVAAGRADMAKGNRLADFAACLRAMPLPRLIANVTLSGVSRPVTGYWRVADPACGCLALHRKVVGRLPWERIAQGYFFESDLLFRVGMLDAKVVEVPVAPVYHERSTSGVRLRRQALPFAGNSLRNFARRVLARYLRRPSLPGLLLSLGALALLAAAAAAMYLPTFASGSAAFGVVLLSGFVVQDVLRQPASPVHPELDGDGTGW